MPFNTLIYIEIGKIQARLNNVAHIWVLPIYFFHGHFNKSLILANLYFFISQSYAYRDNKSLKTIVMYI